MKPFFSIIIPTLNEEHFIPNLLSKIQKQKVYNFEVIVVDGGSNDKTEQITNQYKSYFPVRFIKLKKGDLSYQKNLGAKESKGDYLLFLDADMGILPSFTKTVEKFVKKNPGLIFLPWIFPEEKKEFPDISMIFPVFNRLVEVSQNFNKPFSGGPSQIWAKEVFLKIGGFDKIFGEDHQIIRKAHEWGLRAKSIPQATVSFSLRRMKKEGRMRLFYHFILSHIYLLFNNKLNTEFTYEMGGQLYRSQKKGKPAASLVLNAEEFIKNMKKNFRYFLEREF